MTPVRVRTFYPADPAGTVPGGVDSFIRGLIKWAPEDLEFSLVGMTTDARTRPPGHWADGDVDGRPFRFLPVVPVADAGRRGPLPLALRYTVGAARHAALWRQGFDVFDYHRLEPALLHGGDARPKNAFFHNDMTVIRDEPQADILWRHWPAAYFALESHVMGKLASAWSVREPAAAALRRRYPALAGQVRFTPTWVDPGHFFLPRAVDRLRLRNDLERELGLDPEAFRLAFVGRLDRQKNPLGLLEAMGRLDAAGEPAELICIGDGPLRPEMERAIARQRLDRRVRLLGLRSREEIARLLPAADAFVLPSAYEGMPIALLEALACGLPAAVTPVGEVARVVKDGGNGTIAADRSPAALAIALQRLRHMAPLIAPADCAASVAPYLPRRVLAPVYENYLRLGKRNP